jgi:hypothetical protein
MIIVNPDNSTITINYFNRLGTTPVNVLVYNESTRKTITRSVLSVSNASYYDYLTITNNSYFKDATSYVITIEDVDNNVIYKDKAYATNESVNNNEIYSLNTNQYTENATDNEYIIYE